MKPNVLQICSNIGAMINVHPARVYALVMTESRGDGFDSRGNVLVRFEGHQFRKHTRSKYSTSHPHLSYTYSRSRRDKSLKHGWSAYLEAYKIDKWAAMMSTSFGAFQVMGFTHDEAGFSNVEKYVAYLSQSVENQVLAFCKLLQHRGLIPALRAGKWVVVARGYNGASYDDFDYDGKLARHFARGLKLTFPPPTSGKPVRSAPVPVAKDERFGLPDDVDAEPESGSSAERDYDEDGYQEDGDSFEVAGAAQRPAPERQYEDVESGAMADSNLVAYKTLEPLFQLVRNFARKLLTTVISFCTVLSGVVYSVWGIPGVKWITLTLLAVIGIHLILYVSGFLTFRSVKKDAERERNKGFYY